MTTRALILGASGQIASHVVRALQSDRSAQPTLYLRDANRIGKINTTGMIVLEGDVSDEAALHSAVVGQDIVVASLSGDMEGHARHIIQAMKKTGAKRLVFVTSLGIYDEVPGAFGQWNNAMIGEDLKSYRRAAEMVEAAGLDATIVRPAWLTDYDEVDYEFTSRHEPFRGPKYRAKASRTTFSS